MRLAIVIPYYKKKFFRETLQSIANQTCKDFVVYIGDDASLESPVDLINEYRNSINIVYKRYEDNLGTKDLVAQWERSIAMAQEDWIWLFSDDDRMSATCVEEFYNVLQNDSSVQIMRYTKKFCNIIQNTSFLTTYKKGYSDFSSFLMDGLDLTENHVTMPEFVFHRALYEKYGIINVPLAWGSDKITYLQYVYETGKIFNLESVVNYIYSDENISANKISKQKKQKFQGRLQTIEWEISFIKRIKNKYPEIDIVNVKNLFVDRQCSYIKVDGLSFWKKLQIVYRLLVIVCSRISIKNIIKTIVY